MTDDSHATGSRAATCPDGQVCTENCGDRPCVYPPATSDRAAKIKAVEQMLGDIYGRMRPLVDYHYPTAEQIVDLLEDFDA